MSLQTKVLKWSFPVTIDSLSTKTKTDDDDHSAPVCIPQPSLPLLPTTHQTPTLCRFILASLTNINNQSELYLLMLTLWPVTLRPGVTQVRAYHRPPDGHFSKEILCPHFAIGQYVKLVWLNDNDIERTRCSRGSWQMWCPARKPPTFEGGSVNQSLSLS